MNMRDCQFDQRVVADESYFVDMYLDGAAHNPHRVTTADLDTPELASEFALAYMQEHEHAEVANIGCFIQYTDGTSEIRPRPICQITRADLPEVMAPC